MREILFRGKRIGGGAFEEGFFANGKHFCGEYGAKKAYILDPNHPMYTEVDPDTVGQYTGMTDKNGKKIFEGDIIRMNNCPEDIVEVCFGEFGCIDMETATATDLVLGWYYKVIPTDVLSRLNPFSLPFQMNTYWAKECAYEVIGNIYDNPELMDMKDSRRACYRNADSTPGRYYE